VRTHAWNVQLGLLLIKMEFAAKFNRLANNSIVRKVSARNVMKDTRSPMENVIEMIRQLLPTLDAPSGKVESANSAPRDGTSIHKTSVCLSVISAQPGPKRVHVKLATTDLLLKRVLASKITTLASSPTVTSSVKFGPDKSAQNAQTELFSIKTVFVLQ